MSDLAKPAFIDVAKAGSKLIQAHEDIKSGVATHADKVIVARDMRLKKLESDRKLVEGANVHKQTVRSTNY